LKTFGETIRQLREVKGLLQRQVAAQLDIDTALLSKVERGDRAIHKDHIKTLSQILDADESELTALWLSDQVYEILRNEKQVLNALKLVISRIGNDIKKV
jgi:transcriptional regulator with XRE-family HTH domain